MEKLLSRQKAVIETVEFEFGNTAEVIKILLKELKGLEEGIKFDIIKIPTGGATSFELPTDDPNNTEAVKEIVGVIIEHKPVNALWENGYSGENEPPSCYSKDAITGYSADGEVKFCKECENNKFGSSDNKYGKKCKNMIHLYIMLENEPLPVILVLPPTSIPNFNDYLAKRIVSRGLRLSQVVTKIILVKAKSRGGISYSQAQFILAGKTKGDGGLMLKESLLSLLETKETSLDLLESEKDNEIEETN